MRYFKYLLSFIIIGIGTIVCAQTPLSTTTWSGYADASPHGSFTNIPTGTGVTFSQWRRYNNATFQSATDGYNSQNLTGNPLRFIASYIKTDANTSLNVSQVTFVVRRSNTGPGYFNAYFYFPATGVVSSIGTGYLNNTNNQTITFPTNYCIPANDSVEIRLSLSGATNSGGTFRIVNGTSISGTTTSMCNVQNVFITPPSIVCNGDNATIALASAPGTSVVYNMNGDNILGQLLLDTVVTDATGNASITVNNITADSTVSIISAFITPCCAVNIMQNVILSPQPYDTPFFTIINNYCSGALIPALPTTSNNGVTGSWSPAISNTTTTTYSFTPSPGQCVNGIQDQTITVFPAPHGIETATICYGESYIFNGATFTTSNNSAKDTFIVAGGCDSIVTLNLTVLDSAQSVTTNLEACEVIDYDGHQYTQSIVLSDTLKSALGCDSVYKIVNIKVQGAATNFQINTAGCGEVLLNGIRYAASTVLQDTLYSSTGCDSVYRQFNITVYENLNMDYILNPEAPYENERFMIELRGNANFQVLGWHPQQLFPSQFEHLQNMSLANDQEIRVFGVSNDGCEDSLTIPIKVIQMDKEVILPNAFSPNGDGLNDVFLPKLKLERGYRNADFRVFNRFGQAVHFTANMNSGWDGTFNGTPLDVGVYYYTITILFLDGSFKKYSGEVTLIR